MGKPHILGILLLGSFTLASCKRDGTAEHKPSPEAEKKHQLVSEELQRGFPLLPLIEKSLWKKLLHHESAAQSPDTSAQARTEAQHRIDDIATRLRELHPFSRNADTITLGGISYHRKTGHIELMARVNDLDVKRKGEQEDIELILCTPKGRTHESLFVTNARPLHLEILLHLAGYKKADTPSRFQVLISTPNNTPIKVGDLLVSKTRESLPTPLTWEFSGSDFDDLYRPDLTGDLIILWHAHDSVLRTTDDKIARNETRLLAKPHPELQPNLAVKIILVPTPS